jgi:hypothetical protein
MATGTGPAVTDVSARVQAATAAMQRTGAEVAQARARLQAIRQAGGWEAQFQEVEAQRALAVAEDLYDTACAEHAAAREAEREQRRREFLPKKRALVAQLDAKLAEAAAVNAQLVDLEARERDAVGNHTAEWWAWPELMQSTALIESRLHIWRRCAQGYGLLDGEK